MSLNPIEKLEIKLYLLGRLDVEQRSQKVEERMLTEPDYYEELLLIEDEVVDQYLAGELSPDERNGFEQYFLGTPERVRKLRFARAFRSYVSAASPKPDAQNFSRPWVIFRALLASPARAAAFALVLICCSLLAWWFYAASNSAVDRGLVALNAAYHDKRPVEARITDFNYAPWHVTRDGSQAKVDTTSLDHAERILLDEWRARPGPAADHALGRLYLAKHNYDQAIEIFNRALKADERNAQLHNDLGVALLEKGRGEGIEASARAAEQLNRAIELDGSLLEARFNRALAYQQMLLPRQAEESWREYLRMDASSPWADEARRNLKLLEENKGTTSQDVDNALQQLFEARRAGDEAAAWKVVSRNYASAGNAVTNKLLDSFSGLDAAAPRVDSDEALSTLSYLAQLEIDRDGDRYTSDLVKYYERATPKTRTLLVDARIHMNAGYALFTQSKFAEAVREYNSAMLAYGQAGDDTGKIFVEYLLAHCYVFLPELEKARLAFERLSAVCKTKEYRWLLAYCLYDLAHVSADSSEYSKAVDYSSQALDAFERADDLDGVLRCLIQLADVNQALNRVERSLEYLRRSLALAGETPTGPKQMWGILVQIASSLNSMHLSTAALFYQKEALSLALETGIPLYITRSYGYVGSAYAAVKMYAEAESVATQAFEIGKSRGDAGGVEMMANASQQLGDILRQSGKCGKAVEAYDRSIQLYGGLNFEYYSYAAHKGKLLCFMAGADNQIAGEELRTVLSLSEQYRSKITAESQRNSFFDMEQDVYDLAITYEFARAADPIMAFAYSEESRARSLLDAMRYGAQVQRKGYGPDITLPSSVTKPMTFNEVQAGMPDGAQVLQYAVLDDKLLIWAVTKSDIHTVEVDVGSEALTEKARFYLAAVSAPPADAFDVQARLAAELYKILIAPAEPFLDKTKFLCVVPDKILNYIPYSALVSPANGKYLVEDYEIGVAPSSTIFVEVSTSAEERVETFKERLLSVGDPSFNRAAFPSLPDLPSAAREASAVSAFYGVRRVLLRDEASEQAVKTEIEKADIVHLAMHYVVDERSEMLSGFPLAAESARAAGHESSEGFLQSYEIYGMKLPRTRLVVLSACQTGIEQQYGGEGAVGVARPFLVAGVPVVVASLWPVDSDASAELMIKFHRNRVRESLTASAALRRAQIEMAHGPDALYRNPYYWSSFVAVGGHSQS